MSPVPQQRSTMEASGQKENGTNGTGGTSPPETVQTGGEEVVEQVVAACDSVEHALDVFGRLDGATSHGFGGSRLRLVHAVGRVVRRVVLRISASMDSAA